MRKIKSTSIGKEWTTFTVTIGATVFISIALFLPLGCLPCCPKIVTGHEFRSVEKFVCPECPDNRVHLYFKVRYAKEKPDGTDDGKCAPKDHVIGVQMCTGNTFNPHSSIFKHPEQGFMVCENPSGGYFQTVRPPNQDDGRRIKIRLVATGDKKCKENVLRRYVTVKAASRGDNHLLCFPFNDMPSGSVYWMGNADVFGKGVIVTHVVNQNPFSIHVYHAGEEAKNLGSGQMSNAHRDTVASGRWVLDIADPGVRAQYIREQKELCVRVYVTCRCP